MPTPHEIYWAWRRSTDAQSKARRAQQDLEQLLSNCSWSGAEVHLEGGQWSMVITPGDPPRLSVRMEWADACTP